MNAMAKVHGTEPNTIQLPVAAIDLTPGVMGRPGIMVTMGRTKLLQFSETLIDIDRESKIRSRVVDLLNQDPELRVMIAMTAVGAPGCLGDKPVVAFDLAHGTDGEIHVAGTEGDDHSTEV